MLQEQALKILKTGANVFLTGEPGSGKTHTISEYVSYLRKCGFEPAITASTGIAATHLGGMTIHSWSGIGIREKLEKYDLIDIAGKKYIKSRVSKTKVLIIDEVSMLSANTLDMVDAVCRRLRQDTRSFGGMQVVLVGDFFQLPPVTRAQPQGATQANLLGNQNSVFAFDSSAWENANLTTCYLTEQYRQDDKDYLDVLSAIRSNKFKEGHLRLLAQRKKQPVSSDDITKLFTHNINVDAVNNAMLAKVPGKPRTFDMEFHGRNMLVEALKRSCLSPEKLILKIGTVVMFTKNNMREGYVNGTLGKVIDFDTNTGFPIVATREGKNICAEPAEWLIEENGEVRALISQVPLRLAWAITVHKSQGMSLDAAVMDLSGVFEYGQGYVALSRVRRLSGLFLLGWNERAFQIHPEILRKDLEFRNSSEKLLKKSRKKKKKDAN